MNPVLCCFEYNPSRGLRFAPSLPLLTQRAPPAHVAAGGDAPQRIIYKTASFRVQIEEESRLRRTPDRGGVLFRVYLSEEFFNGGFELRVFTGNDLLWGVVDEDIWLKLGILKIGAVSLAVTDDRNTKVH